MKIEMVLSEVREDGDVPLEAAHPFLGESVRRDFHRRRFAGRVHHLAEQVVNIERFRRGSDRR